MDFNDQKSKILLLDINSCFATIEQQANPFLRYKPVVVAAYTTGKGTILAASVDAKKLGVKTGMRVIDGKKLCPNLTVLPPDPQKYRFVHKQLHNLLSEYSPQVEPKSIDEFILEPMRKDLLNVAKEIKERIKNEIGDYITVSIGIAPNRYLAKVAAGIVKPDGLVEINKDSYLKIYSSLSLTDLTGIKQGNSRRLNSVGIYNVLDFYKADLWKLKIAFKQVGSHSWYLRLRGYEIDSVPFSRKSYGNSVAIGKNIKSFEGLSPILSRLVDKMSTRLRANGYKAQGIHLSLNYKNGDSWHKGKKLVYEVFDSREILRETLILLSEASPKNFVRIIAVTCFNLKKDTSLQFELFRDAGKNKQMVEAIDKVNSKWGDFTLGIARSYKGENIVLDRIAFGGSEQLDRVN